VGKKKRKQREKDFSIKLCLLVIIVTTDLAKRHSRKERERESKRDTLGLTFGELWEHSEIPSCTIQVLHDCSTTRRE
jgi:hypothetical protein